MKKWGMPTNTKRFFNVVVGLGFTLLVIWIFVISQTDNSGPNKGLTAEQQVSLDSLRNALGRSPESVSKRDDEGLLDNAIITFILLGGGLLVLWIWSRRQPESNVRTLFTEVGEQQLAPGQTLKVIEINDEYWVLGVTSDNINLLEKMPRENWDLPPAHSTATGSPKSFSDLMKKYVYRNDNT